MTPHYRFTSCMISASGVYDGQQHDHAASYTPLPPMLTMHTSPRSNACICSQNHIQKMFQVMLNAPFPFSINYPRLRRVTNSFGIHATGDSLQYEYSTSTIYLDCCSENKHPTLHIYTESHSTHHSKLSVTIHPQIHLDPLSPSLTLSFSHSLIFLFSHSAILPFPILPIPHPPSSPTNHPPQTLTTSPTHPLHPSSYSHSYSCSYSHSHSHSSSPPYPSPSPVPSPFSAVPSPYSY